MGLEDLLDYWKARLGIAPTSRLQELIDTQRALDAERARAVLSELERVENLQRMAQTIANVPLPGTKAVDLGYSKPSPAVSLAAQKLSEAAQTLTPQTIELLQTLGIPATPGLREKDIGLASPFLERRIAGEEQRKTIQEGAAVETEAERAQAEIQVTIPQEIRDFFKKTYDITLPEKISRDALARLAPLYEPHIRTRGQLEILQATPPETPPVMEQPPTQAELQAAWETHKNAFEQLGVTRENLSQVTTRAELNQLIERAKERAEQEKAKAPKPLTDTEETALNSMRQFAHELAFLYDAATEHPEAFSAGNYLISRLYNALGWFSPFPMTPELLNIDAASTRALQTYIESKSGKQFGIKELELSQKIIPSLRNSADKVRALALGHLRALQRAFAQKIRALKQAGKDVSAWEPYVQNPAFTPEATDASPNSMLLRPQVLEPQDYVIWVYMDSNDPAEAKKGAKVKLGKVKISSNELDITSDVQRILRENRWRLHSGPIPAAQAGAAPPARVEESPAPQYRVEETQEAKTPPARSATPRPYMNPFEAYNAGLKAREAEK